MKTLILIFTLALIQFVAAESKCSNDPATWCQNIENAKSCNVVEQCWTHVWSEKHLTKKLSTDFVNFTLYYETLCPDCQEFMSTQVLQAFQEVGSIMNLTLVPYGNAKETYRSETKLWQFSCQHGSDECWGNLLHSCLIYYHPKTADHFPFVSCMEANKQDDIKTAASQCATQYKISMDELNKCMTSRLGNMLQHQYAVQTEQLNPPHKYVPWVTLNGEHTEDIQQQAQENLVALVCKSYKGSNRPAACDKKRACLKE